MAHGRIARASWRYPDARRRAARYGCSRLARRADLPPHLLPGLTRRRKGTPWLRWVIAGGAITTAALLLAFVAFVVSTVSAVTGTLAAYQAVNRHLPDAGRVAVGTFQTSRIYDRDGHLLQEVDDTSNPYGGWRTFVPLSQVSPYLINATVAAEDATFWTHYGVEPIAIARGVSINFSGAGSSGASTITQQLVRSLFPEQIGTEVSVTRKFKEALAAVALERAYSKEDILTMYLNQIFYGERSYGIEAAANTFFAKHAKDLDLAEASLLAGLPQRPTGYDPIYHLDVAKRRQAYVLNQMVKLHYITREQADAALAEPLTFASRSGAIQNSPHFVEYVKQYVADHWGEEELLRGGLQITTTISQPLQDEAEKIVQEQIKTIESYNAHNAAMVVMVPYTGEVLAMVGSVNYNDPVIDGQFNVAIARRQPGSAIKPIVYSAAFESGWNPGTVILDYTFKRQTPEGIYQPENYTGIHYGAVTVRTALANSLNIPAVKALDYAGQDHFLDTARKMGITESYKPENNNGWGLSLALGAGELTPVELTNAYATLANEGRFVPANPILEIKDSQGNVLYKLDRQKVFQQAPQVLKAEYAYQITSILTDDQARRMVFAPQNTFESTQAALGRPTAAKSGTSNNWVDTWTMGYTTDVAIGVWVGNNDNSPIAELDGIQSAGPIWSRTMIELHQNPEFAKLLLGPDGQPLPQTFARPPGIYLGQVCGPTGHRPTGNQDTRTEFLVRGEGPSLRCDQLDEWERNDLDGALRDLQSPNVRWFGGAVASIRRYASAVGITAPDPSRANLIPNGTGTNSPPIQQTGNGP